MEFSHSISVAKIEARGATAVSEYYIFIIEKKKGKLINQKNTTINQKPEWLFLRNLAATLNYLKPLSADIINILKDATIFYIFIFFLKIGKLCLIYYSV